MLAGFPNLSPEFEVNLFLPHKLSRVVVLTINLGSVYMVFLWHRPRYTYFAGICACFAHCYKIIADIKITMKLLY